MDLQTHFEEFLHLAGLGHDKALICWGGFYFRRGDSPFGEWRIVDDEELAAVAPSPRSETIGAGSEAFGLPQWRSSATVAWWRGRGPTSTTTSGSRAFSRTPA